ncbi:MAG: hypothetical protein ABSG95_14850 [Solirubrobacteraceae bacterium]
MLDENFVGWHPSIEPAWAGFWSLDDHRGGPPPNVTADRVFNPQELFASIAAGSAITTVPACHAAVILNVLTGVVAIPLLDADPSVMALAGREDHVNPLIRALLEVAESLAEGGPDDPQAAPPSRLDLGADAPGAP